MNFLSDDIQPLGLGCWPIGGAMYAADGSSLGYANSNDRESINAIHAALSSGITLFDTAAAYGAGHSERLLGKAIKTHPEAIVVTKIGIAIDERSKTLTGDDVQPESVMPAIDRCLGRLDRDVIDLLLLHQNELPVSQASLLFDEMDKAIEQGKIKAYGWSTDITDSVNSTCQRRGFEAVEHAMHVLMDAPTMQRLLEKQSLHALIRSPLAMGLLSGKYTLESKLDDEDVRATNPGWAKYYLNGRPNPDYIQRFQSVRELLHTDGRTTVQGALAWLWSKSGINIPIPGARTVAQVEGLAAAISLGPLPQSTMDEIDQLIGGENQSPGNEAR